MTTMRAMIKTAPHAGRFHLPLNEHAGMSTQTQLTPSHGRIGVSAPLSLSAEVTTTPEISQDPQLRFVDTPPPFHLDSSHTPNLLRFVHEKNLQQHVHSDGSHIRPTSGGTNRERHIFHQFPPFCAISSSLPLFGALSEINTFVALYIVKFTDLFVYLTVPSASPASAVFWDARCT